MDDRSTSYRSFQDLDIPEVLPHTAQQLRARFLLNKQNGVVTTVNGRLALSPSRQFPKTAWMPVHGGKRNSW